MYSKTALFAFACLFSWSWLNGQTVNTQYGPVTGKLNGGVYAFLGIPYAAPPVDSLRWRPTAAPQNWTAPILAQQFPPKCPQKHFTQGDTTGVFEGAEDCLYLNVWSPDLSASLPVMIFIHGGGNQGGSTSETGAGTALYDGKNMAKRGNVVLVSIQYRLGPLGYLAHPGLESENAKGIAGNYGVMDQLFALQWVRQNIAGFGGNPDNVTIFGESAGGVNVGNLLTTPLAKGLFHKAIIQSAAPGIERYDSTSAKGAAFVNSFIATGSNAAKIAYMRSLSATSIVSGEKHPIQGGIVQQQWRPTLDHYIFSNFPEAVFQTGQYNKVPLIIGSNADEMSLSAPATVYPFMVTALVNTYIPPAYKAQALALYPPGSNNTEARQSYVGMLTDAQFTNPVRRTAACVSKNQSQPVWRYFFSHTHNPAIPLLGSAGAYHGIELFYVFNTWENAPVAIGPGFAADDAKVQEASLTYWTNFAYTGNPNGANLPAWPQYHADTDCYLEIKGTPDGSHCGLRTAKCDFWDALTWYTGCSSSSASGERPSDTSPFSVYPNPVSSKLHIQAPDACNFEASLYAVSGLEAGHFQSQPEIDFSGLPPGIYLLRLSWNGQTEFRKIVKAN